jgi:histidinol-phosphate aminotransferase
MISSLTKPAIQKIPAYIPGDSIESVKEKYHVTEILKLASNENQLGTSPMAMKAMSEALSQVNLYPDAFCMELRIKIGKAFGLTPHNVVISVGASGTISLIGEVFLCPGDEVIYCNPTFGTYRGAAARNSATPIALPLLAQGAYDLDGILKAITPKTKLIFVCNSNNPTGYAYSHEQLKAIIDSVPSTVITVMDEAYIEFSGDPDIRSTADLISE